MRQGIRSGSKPSLADQPVIKKQTIRVVLPDSGPLISLACADALDLLLSFHDGVRIVLTDIVDFEVTHRSDDLADAAAIRRFIEVNKSRIDVMPTTVGSLALEDIKRRREAGQQAWLAKDIGELSITSFVIAMRTTNPCEPTLVILEDDWFESNTYALPGNVHLLSTSAWLDGLEQMRVIESAADVRSRIRKVRPNFRAEHFLDQEASKQVHSHAPARSGGGPAASGGLFHRART
jgi:hypothetical protein